MPRSALTQTEFFSCLEVLPGNQNEVSFSEIRQLSLVSTVMYMQSMVPEWLLYWRVKLVHYRDAILAVGSLLGRGFGDCLMDRCARAKERRDWCGRRATHE